MDRPIEANKKINKQKKYFDQLRFFFFKLQLALPSLCEKRPTLLIRLDDLWPKALSCSRHSRPQKTFRRLFFFWWSFFPEDSKCWANFLCWTTLKLQTINRKVHLPSVPSLQDDLCQWGSMFFLCGHPLPKESICTVVLVYLWRKNCFSDKGFKYAMT